MTRTQVVCLKISTLHSQKLQGYANGLFIMGHVEGETVLYIGSEYENHEFLKEKLTQALKDDGISSELKIVIKGWYQCTSKTITLDAEFDKLDQEAKDTLVKLIQITTKKEIKFEEIY
jgi:hypothetical protein